MSRFVEKDTFVKIASSEEQLDQDYTVYKIFNKNRRYLGKIDQYGDLDSEDKNLRMVFNEMLKFGVFKYKVEKSQIVRERLDRLDRDYSLMISFLLISRGFIIESEKRYE